MKKFISLTLAALLSVGALSANTVSRSFFSVRPAQSPIARQNLLIDQAKEDGRVLRKRNLQITGFGGVSTNSDDLSRYFMMGKNELLVRNSETALQGTEYEGLLKDIQAHNFNIDAESAAENFQSTLKMDPKQTVFGTSLSFRSPIKDHYWVALEAPLVHVRNKVNLNESSITAAALTGQSGVQGTLTPANMVAAFKQTGMTYGRIDDAHGDMKATRIADLTLKLGYEPIMFNRKDMYMSPYVGLILPTGNKAKARHMFEAIAGNGGHLGFMVGTHGEFEVSNVKSGKLWATYRIESQYLFQNTQKRTMDLKYNGAWSRYLTMYDNETQRARDDISSKNFGTNIMTQDVHVTPGYFGNIDTSMSYVCDKWHATVGYRTHARQGEDVKLAGAWNGKAAIIASGSTNNDDSNPFRTIGNNLVNADIFEGAESIHPTIKEDRIDFNSAAHPGGVSHSLYASVGRYCPQESPRAFELGASYEFSKDNASMDRFCGWVKAQLSF